MQYTVARIGIHGFLASLKNAKVQLQNSLQHPDETFLKIASELNLSSSQTCCSPLFSWISYLSKIFRASIYLYSGNCIYDYWVKSEMLSGTWIIQCLASNESLWKMECWLAMAYDCGKSILLSLLVPCDGILMKLCDMSTVSGVWQIWRMVIHWRQIIQSFNWKAPV